MRRRAQPAVVALLCVIGGCSKKLVDPPPPVTSMELLIAPPGALGARAATLSPLPAPTIAAPETTDPDLEPELDAGVPGTNDGAGVAL